MKSLLLLLPIFIVGCGGYGFQGKSNPWKSRGLEKVYVNILVNNSLRAGAEVPFTSAFVKVFSRGNKLRVVNDEKEADIIVEANVDSISSTINNSNTVPALSNDPEAAKLGDYIIATEYTAKATVNVRLVDRAAKKVLIEQSFDRSRIYPGNNRFGLQGTTSVLINDSQFQLALNEIARNIAFDAYDTLLEAF